MAGSHRRPLLIGGPVGNAELAAQGHARARQAQAIDVEAALFHVPRDQILIARQVVSHIGKIGPDCCSSCRS